MIAARQQWESRWRRLPFYLAYESHDISNDDRMALECMKIILADIWKSMSVKFRVFNSSRIANPETPTAPSRGTV